MQLTRTLETLPTTCLLVLRHGRVGYEYGDPAEVSYLGSARKSILSLLYGRPVTDGVIDLASTLAELDIDDVGGLLPIERRATVRDLLTGRSGVYHPSASATDLGIALPERGSKLPGAEFHYNAWDPNVLGTIYEQRTGRRVFDALAEDLAGPLGFADFDPARQRALGRPERSRHLAHHMFLSARDLARVGILVADGGRWNGRELIPPGWLRASTTPQPGNYGYLWWIFGSGILAAGAFGQYLLVLPEEGLVIVHRVAVPDEVAIARNNEGGAGEARGLVVREFGQLVRLIRTEVPPSGG
jgi:CubicO group peptidase (beta-lactamase class C family)